MVQFRALDVADEAEVERGGKDDEKTENDLFRFMTFSPLLVGVVRQRLSTGAGCEGGAVPALGSVCRRLASASPITSVRLTTLRTPAVVRVTATATLPSRSVTMPIGSTMPASVTTLMWLAERVFS